MIERTLLLVSIAFNILLALGFMRQFSRLRQSNQVLKGIVDELRGLRKGP